MRQRGISYCVYLKNRLPAIGMNMYIFCRLTSLPIRQQSLPLRSTESTPTTTGGELKRPLAGRIDRTHPSSEVTSGLVWDVFPPLPSSLTLVWWAQMQVVEALLGVQFSGRGFCRTPLVAGSRNTLALDAAGQVR